MSATLRLCFDSQSTRIGQAIFADCANLRSDLGVAVASNMWGNNCSISMTEVAALMMREERASLDIGQNPSTGAGTTGPALTLDLIFGEVLNVIQEVTAEDDRVRPQIASDVLR